MLTIAASKVEVQQALQDAVCNGNNTEIDQLIVQGADVYAKNDDGSTLLHWATAKGQIHTLTHLISAENGCTVEISCNRKACELTL